jgi:hypothetical protein
MLTFAMALTIPPAEVDECMRLARPGYEAISLTNDLYSWRKERVDAVKAGQDYVFNAIWVIMEERGCSEMMAIEICKGEIRRRIAQFDANVEGARYSGLSLDTIKYLEAVRLSHVGNLVWSIYCPRYHGGYVFATPSGRSHLCAFEADRGIDRNHLRNSSVRRGNCSIKSSRSYSRRSTAPLYSVDGYLCDCCSSCTRKLYRAPHFCPDDFATVSHRFRSLSDVLWHTFHFASVDLFLQRSCSYYLIIVKRSIVLTHSESRWAWAVPGAY